MGSGRWSTTAYNAATTLRSVKGVADFDYSMRTASQPVSEQKAHPDLDPADLADGGVRESRDSTEHPTSVAISVLFDVTGSMSDVPQALQKRLPDLLNALLLNGYVTDPQILMGAVGDGYSDRVPLQVGQFESDNRIDDQLRNIFLEGRGGGTYEESYELTLYFLGRHTATDCWEKRQHKGYAFIIGDEKPYDVLRPRVVEKAFGKDLLGGETIPIETLIEQVQERFHLFFITPNQTSHYGDPVLVQTWERLLGANYIQVDDPEFVVETISLLIGITEGNVDLADGVAALEAVNPKAAQTVGNAVGQYAATLSATPPAADPNGGTVRI